MAYKIRYKSGSRRMYLQPGIFRFQAAMSVALLFLTGISRLLWAEGRNPAMQMIVAGPITLTERAVSALAGALSEGEGWYHALAVWCRTILDG